MRLKNIALVLGQNSIFNYGENWKYFYLAKLVKSILKRIWQEAIIAYFLVKKKTHTHTNHTGPERWERDISIDTKNWTDVFKMALKTCKESKSKELHFKFFIGLSLQRNNVSDMG